MDRYIRARDRTVNQIRAIKNYSGAINNNTSVEAIQMREVNLEKLYKDFNNQEIELLAFENYTPITEEVDVLYLDTTAILKAAINTRIPRAQETQAEMHDLNATLGQFIGQQQTFLQGIHQSQNVRLPKFNINPFAGDYKLWPSFHDLYITTVHENTSIKPVQKLQILNSLLKDEPAALIRHIQVTDQNYEEAWAKLVARYNKPKAIIASLIQVFMEQRACSHATHKELRKLCDTSDEVLRGLRVLGPQAETRDPWLVQLLLNKIDPDSRQLWAKETVAIPFPTVNKLLEFLVTRCDALESCGAITRSTNTVQRNTRVHHTTQADKWSCIACKNDHNLYKCPLFKSMNVENRMKLLEGSNSCTNCLRFGHLESRCFSRAVCLICKKRHHSLLHKDQQSTNLHATVEKAATINTPSTVSNNMVATASTINSQSHQSINKENLQSTSQQSTNVLTTSSPENQTSLATLLPTALIYIQANNGQRQLVRALLDSGSQSSFITEACVQRLGLRRRYSNLSIYGLASCAAGNTKGKTNILIQSRVTPHYTISITAHIIEKISSSLPERLLPITETNEIWQLQLADPQFNRPSAIDILIGAEYFLDILGEQKKTIQECPPLHSSKFGWLVAGNIGHEQNPTTPGRNFGIQVESQISNEELMEMLKRFWQVEENSVEHDQLDKNDPCEILYATSTTRSTDGKFIVRLPFINPRPKLGDSFCNAKSRMLGTEKRFIKSPQYQEEYQRFMAEYINLGQMQPIPWSEIPRDNNNKYFMPHHAVVKESTTTKLRVVFDASCKTTTTVSLNDCLLTGPKLQPNLTTTLLRFRLHAIAINADIEKMYRQILVDPSDANFQCILWRRSPTEALSPYKCMTVTYGTTCAPFLAIRTLEEVARMYENKYPEAANTIRQNFYMDDLLTGSDSVKNAIKLKDQIIEILNSCHFRLRKWKSNSQLFLESVVRDNAEDVPKLIEDDQSTKTLGIMWYPTSDIFTFKMNLLPEDVTWTKRKMLSESAKLYDPLGWISPIIVWFKMLLQKLWLTKTDWDEEAPNHVLVLWKKIYYNLNRLENIKIPRWLLISATPVTVQLHGFSDASESAYGCVIYLRSCNDNGDITCRLVSSKSKVAPIKQISLPRLELCGAVLLAEQINYCRTTFNLSNISVYAWTDSMVVLHWLSDIPARWKTFIGNRTSRILEIIPREKWSHVVSHQNPADYVSRGVEPKVISTLKTWWHGPSWLSLSEANWPKIKQQSPLMGVDSETRSKAVIVLMETAQNEFVNQLLAKFSSWFRIKKIVAYILRVNRANKSDNKEQKKTELAFWEYKKAETVLIREIQASSFQREIIKLRKNVPVETDSVLSSLDPFIDSDGIVRVGGRLRNAQLNYNSQHPIILPKNHPVNLLIIQEIHISNLHAGNTLMLSVLRQRYWMIGARYQIKRHIKSCLICIRYRHTQIRQKMADLPMERCTRSRPFLNTGIDYLGPIYIKTGQHRNAPLTKAYVEVFICLAVKAVHLEVVTSLSTEAFLAALKRFVSRRGCPSQIWCDNGSNFIGANNELKRLKKEIFYQQNNKIISNFILQKDIEFKFNPASAPHFGGLWEAAVKSVKHHFRRTTKEAKFNFEETTTIVTQIEGLLNSRPLCRVNDDPTSLEMLTPGHFLIGDSLVSVPEPVLEHVSVNRLSRWQNMQRRVESFWKAWSRDYLNTLQERNKWRKGNSAINIDDLVLIKEDHLAPSQWLLGRIKQTHPGNDGIVRVVTVKTATSMIKRPTTKLIILPKLA